MARLGARRATRLGAPLGVALAAALLAPLPGCSTASGTVPPTARDGVIQVVAAENFWGSIASQVGGRHVHVVAIVANPNTDPHSYEPTAADARAIALSQLVIENGIGYDPWVARLVAADQGGQDVLDVGGLLGVPDDGNPHRWYNPADVSVVIGRLAAEYSRLDPANKAYFARRRAYVDTVALRTYHSLIASISSQYRGTPVGASESIFAMLAPALGLRLITPYAFLRAISEGTEVAAADKQAIDTQIRRHLIKIYVYNSQNTTPDVLAQLMAARAARIPVASITETLAPPTASFQAWQVRQLGGIKAALARAAGR